MNKHKLNKILSGHEAWLDSKGDKGKRANLSDANLSDTNLSGADLRRANLTGADLSKANLRGTDLRVADITMVKIS